METKDEIPLEDHRYFRARLNHLESQHPAALLIHLESGTLTDHLREVTARAMQASAELTINRNLPQDLADELVMNQIVADPREQSRLVDPSQMMRLRSLLDHYQAAAARLPRTYLSERETIE